MSDSTTSDSTTSDSAAQPTVVITGASGLIGTKLTAAFEADGWRVLRAVRREAKHDQEVSYDPKKGLIEREKLEGVEAIVHLAGAGIADKRWTESYKQTILDSRVDGTTLIAETLAGLNNKPKVFACASAIGYYGDRGNEELDEQAAAGDGYLPEVCLQWERSCEAAREAGIRTVNMRIGVVLSTEGGALKEMLTPFKLGGGGVLGSGKQYFSWIELEDIVRAMHFIVKNDSLSGPVNLVAPNPVTNYEFTKTLGRVLSRPTILPMPAFAARLLFGEMADALLLASTRVVPSKLTSAGFSYEHGELEPALKHVLDRG